MIAEISLVALGVVIGVGLAMSGMEWALVKCEKILKEAASHEAYVKEKISNMNRKKDQTRAIYEEIEVRCEDYKPKRPWSEN